MTAPGPASGIHHLRNTVDFSLVLGGPLFQLWRRTRLSDDALRLVRRRIVAIALIAWLPLLVLSALEGHLLGGLTVPFMQDVEVHVRFLVVVPLLIGAELVVHRRIRPVVLQFLERGLIPAGARARFDAAVASSFRLRNSVLAEVLIIAVVYGVGILIIWRNYVALDTSTWYALPSPGGARLSLAGMWYGYVSLAIFQFLLCRWYFRIGIWAYFLWQVSRIRLNLVATHPDRTGGLGFVASAIPFAMIATAHGALIAGQIANRIFFLGATLPEFKMQVGVLVLWVLGIAFAPALVFVPQLFEAKLAGKREYGVLAQRYVREFDAKWLRGGAPSDEPLVGSGDIQSLADLGNSLEVVQAMRTTPVTTEAILQLAVAVLIPVIPLGLTMMPLEQLVGALFGLVF